MIPAMSPQFTKLIPVDAITVVNPRVRMLQKSSQLLHPPPPRACA